MIGCQSCGRLGPPCVAVIAVRAQSCRACGQSCDHNNTDRLLCRRRPRQDLVWSPASPDRAVMRPASILSAEIASKRLELLHDLVPKAVRIAVLVNPANLRVPRATIERCRSCTHHSDCKSSVLNARTSREIDAAFATLARPSRRALCRLRCVLHSRRVQLTLCAAHIEFPRSIRRGKSKPAD